MRTKNIFIALVLMVAAVLLSVPMATAAPEGPQSVLTYTAPAKEKIDKETFDCKIASHKFDKATGVGTITFKGQLKAIRGSCNYYSFYDSAITNIVIPNSVTSIEYGAFEGCSSLTSITIPNSVTSIGYEAFAGCSSLTSITIPNSVTEIGGGAFYGCSNLTSITIPNSVTEIGEYAFDGCDALKDVNVNITNLAKYCKGNTICNIPGNKHLYIDNKEITELVIPNSVTNIGISAFEGCSSLTSITIPNSVRYIEDYAFSRCSSLTSITIGNSVSSIGDYAFAGCYALKDVNINITDLAKYCTNNAIHKIPGNKHLYINNKEITELVIPNSVTSIREWTFSRCSSLTSITIPNSVGIIGEYAFLGCSNLNSITIPNSVTYIDRYAFSGCSSLTSITIPNSVTSIGDRAFSSCSSLKSVKVSNKYCYDYFKDKVDDIAFYGANASDDGRCLIVNGELQRFIGKGITEYTIPNSVTSIGYEAFYRCSSLTSITIPESVTEIGSGAFYGCSSLTDVTTPEQWINIFVECVSVETINGKEIIRDGSFIFLGDMLVWVDRKLESVSIPASVKSIASTAFVGCEDLKNVNVVDLNLWLRSGVDMSSSKGWNLYDNGKLVTNVTIPNGVSEIAHGQLKSCSSVGSITIPASVKEIGAYAFEGYSNLISVTISNGVTKIGNYAFSNCGKLVSITMPASVKDIGECAFAGCSCLTNVTIGNGVTLIGESAFYDCDSLYNVTIGNGVTKIGNYAFGDCDSLTSITIPNSVTLIGESAFYDCDSLYNVTIGNGVTEIGDCAFKHCTSLTSVTIGNGVTKIGDEAFFDCYSLCSITIPASVAYIGSDVFTRYENYGILYIYMNGATPPTLGEIFQVWYYYTDWNLIGYKTNRYVKIYVPENALFAYRSADVWNQMADNIEPRY